MTDLIKTKRRGRSMVEGACSINNSARDSAINNPARNSNARFVVATGFFRRMRGLLFSPLEEELVLVLIPCKGIHTFGMSYPIDVAFIDAQGKVLSSYRNLQPSQHRRHSLAAAALERAAQSSAWFERGDCLVIAKDLPMRMT